MGEPIFCVKVLRISRRNKTHAIVIPRLPSVASFFAMKESLKLQNSIIIALPPLPIFTWSLVYNEITHLVNAIYLNALFRQNLQ